MAEKIQTTDRKTPRFFVDPKKILLLLGLVLVPLLAGGGYYLWVIPDSYKIQGRVMDAKDSGLEGITLVSGDQEVTTNKSGNYVLVGLEKGNTVEVQASEDYEKPEFNIDYSNNDKVGLKHYVITEDIKLSQSLLGFVKEAKTNEKYARHNLIWEHLDEPSKQIYSDVDTYEQFFKEGRRLLGEDKGLRDFEIDKENITVREAWTSPQGIEYKSVYGVPINGTLNDGSTRSEVFYVFKAGGKWTVTTGFTKEDYEEVKKTLKELKGSE